MKSISNLLIAAGLVGVAGSLLWWHTFYTDVLQFFGGNEPLPINCIYMIDGACNLVATAANLVGVAAYNPWFFWTSVGLLALGVIIRKLPANDGDDDFTGHTGGRREPFL